ncbi:LysM peptidoglycan-binding domain-containing protein [Rhodohalobacter sp. SW132]|uniref:LysM peptidoglycan-binding domain-containing protein n=1 Tax=Rhodohalobacter sp. SW132 TaxID=2293433 RepID=UPI000E244119|nr:LysM peptidoglycan-binding domain-containing protein [Rhodohalobacter sp. SW132]REL33368.1 LysM peptidoglycan-binding domain-containing protein [Rhodohalobacter sp. SW132]
MKSFTLLSLFILWGALVHAQQSSDTGEAESNVPKKLIPYTNPLLNIGEDRVPVEETRELGELEKETMQRISDVYRIHVLAIDAQIQGDLVQAERHINDAFASIQSLMDDYPEVQNNQRFAALYRSVMAEYREFYAISEPMNDVEGDIFAIQDELFSEKDEWIAEGYNLPDNLTFNRTEVPLVQNQHVNRHLMYYTLRRPEVMERWLERSEYYFPMMLEIFEEEGAPKELIHLSMIESGLVPTARSWASAVGLWQFIRATGAMYGLEVNWWIDERRDPVKSTRAAARHLNDLYDIWGDWHLALAGYNISPRGLRRAIRAGGNVEDYWVAFPYLPRETRGYVPGFIAATMVAMNPEEFGFQSSYGGERYRYDVVDVDGLMPLDALANAAGITTNELKSYNPELLRWATPPGDSYPLKLPVGTRDEFLIAYQEIPKEERAQEIAMHTVSRGETLGFIAQRYGTSVRSLYETNEGLSNVIHPGQRIVVPIAPGSMEQISSDRPSNQPGATASASRTQSNQNQVQAPPNTTSVTYTVKSGDTIGHIAEWYDVRAWQLRAWNGISNTIRVGQQLTVHVPSNRQAYYRQVDDLAFSKKQELERRQRSGEDIFALRFDEASSSGNGSVNYTVRRNETLGGIARRHGVSVAAIQQENNLNGTTIYAGQTLTIPTN